MTVTRSKLQRPAVYSDYGLGVDDVSRPTHVSAYRSPGPGSSFDEVATRTYAEFDDILGWLIESVGFPHGVARALVVQLTQKVHAAGLWS
jgi:hypothetical protein